MKNTQSIIFQTKNLDCIDYNNTLYSPQKTNKNNSTNKNKSDYKNKKNRNYKINSNDFENNKNLFKVTKDYNCSNGNSIKTNIKNNKEAMNIIKDMGYKSENKFKRRPYNTRNKNSKIISNENTDDESTYIYNIENPKNNNKKKEIKNKNLNNMDNIIGKEIKNKCDFTSNNIKENSLQIFSNWSSEKCTTKNIELPNLLGKKRKFPNNNKKDDIDNLIYKYGLKNILYYLNNPVIKIDEEIELGLKPIINESNAVYLHCIYLVYHNLQEKLNELNEKNQIHTINNLGNNIDNSFQNFKQIELGDIKVNNEYIKKVNIDDEFEKNFLYINLFYYKKNSENIYQYNFKERVGNNYVFRCSDKCCDSEAKYNIQTKQFIILREHSISLDNHNYIEKCFYCEILKIFSNNKEYNNMKIFKDIKNKKLIGRLYKT